MRNFVVFIGDTTSWDVCRRVREGEIGGGVNEGGVARLAGYRMAAHPPRDMVFLYIMTGADSRVTM